MFTKVQKELINDFLNDLLINLDMRLNVITNDSSVYDNCRDALDLIAKDGYASYIYKRICEITNYQIDFEDLNEILQSYDIEIKNYHNQLTK